MLAANLFMIVFRLLHIVAGVLWVGSAFLFVGFIGPSAAEVGPSAGPILHAAVKKRKVPKVITGLGITTVVAGWILWLRDLNDYGSLGDWLGSNFGLVLTIGAVLATIAAFLGALGVGRNVERLVDMSDTVAASGRPPTPEQQARIEHLGGRSRSTGRSTSSCCSSRSPAWRRRAIGRSRRLHAADLTTDRSWTTFSSGRRPSSSSAAPGRPAFLV